MKILCELNDRMILGQDGMSGKPPRLTARAIVKNKDGLYAVMYAEKFGLYSLPGGGLEGEEDVLTALRREILEETGCTCDEVRELGIVRENRGQQDYTQISYYYVVTTRHQASQMCLTEAEKASNTTVQWHTPERMVHLIADPVHTTVQRKYLQARDVAALREYFLRNKEEETAALAEIVQADIDGKQGM